MTLLIKNVQLIDGVHDFPERSDVFVAKGKISAIGNFPNKHADETLDGQGAYLAPGFIDVNTDSDHYLTLFDYPSQQDFLRQGVTTIFGGMCGSSLAPLLYGGLESVRKWGDILKSNVSWHTVGEFLDVLDARPLAVNFGTLAGHATIRRALVGDAIRDLTKNERAIFLKVLKRSMAEGAFGLSTGLGYVHARKTPEPELVAFAKAVRDAGGVYATHLRQSGAGIDQSIAETIRVAEQSGVKTLISHFVPHGGATDDYEKALAMIDAVPATPDFRFDLYPFPETLVPLYAFLPEWAQTGGWEQMLPQLCDDWFLTRIKKDIVARFAGDLGQRAAEGDAFVVAQAPGNDILVGRSLDDLREMFDAATNADAIIKLMLSTKLQGTILFRNLDEPLIRKSLTHPRSLVASNAASFSETAAPLRVKTRRTTSTFPKFLELVDNEHLMPLKDAVRKISYEPARMFGLAGRGELREGLIADITGFRGGEIRFTVVNGKVAMKNNEFTDRYAGKALRHRT